MAHTQILVHRWGLDSSVARAKEIVLCKGFAILKLRYFLTFLLKKYNVLGLLIRNGVSTFLATFHFAS